MTYTKDLQTGQHYRVTGRDTVYQCVRVTGDGPLRTVRYRVLGDTYVGEYIAAALSTNEDVN
jgi:hypothetical protein